MGVVINFCYPILIEQGAQFLEVTFSLFEGSSANCAFLTKKKDTRSFCHLRDVVFFATLGGEWAQLFRHYYVLRALFGGGVAYPKPPIRRTIN